jgi:hypothetical protein
MDQSRRDFLRGIAAGLAAAVLPGCGRGAPPPAPAPPRAPASPVPTKAIKHGTLIGPGKYVEKGEARTVLSIIDLDAMPARPRLVPLDFFAHGVSPHPARPTLAMLFEKHGKGCCEVDLVAARVTRPIATAPGREFYGHGAFSADGAVVYCTEVVLSDKKRGVIVVRDGKTYDVVGEFPSYGTSPHDCRLTDGGKTLAITNGGTPFGDDASPPSVTFVDIASERLLEKLEFETPRINAGHLALTSRRELAVVSAMRDGLPPDAPGAVSFRAATDLLRTMTEPADIARRMKGESLSVAIHEPSGTVGVTNPEGNIVTFWNMREERFLKHIELEKPRGIALVLGGRYFAVSYAEPAGIVMQFVDVKTLELVSSARLDRSFLSGSHFIVYPLVS